MTAEQLVRTEIARGTRYRRVIDYAIKMLVDAGHRDLAANLVRARNAADEDQYRLCFAACGKV